MFITTIEIQNGSSTESLESWDGNTESESVNRAIKSADEQNVSADSIVSITTKQV
jgi:hypothetical protein|tara:strand:- start:393 stop:557 length:165 start_codon:yes stop_codon:yes gene_type:complete